MAINHFDPSNDNTNTPIISIINGKPFILNQNWTLLFQSNTERATKSGVIAVHVTSAPGTKTHTASGARILNKHIILCSGNPFSNTNCKAELWAMQKHQIQTQLFSFFHPQGWVMLTVSTCPSNKPALNSGTLKWENTPGHSRVLFQLENTGNKQSWYKCLIFGYGRHLGDFGATVGPMRCGLWEVLCVQGCTSLQIFTEQLMYNRGITWPNTCSCTCV